MKTTDKSLIQPISINSIMEQVQNILKRELTQEEKKLIQQEVNKFEIKESINSSLQHLRKRVKSLEKITEEDKRPGWMLRRMKDTQDPVYTKIKDKQKNMAALKRSSSKKPIKTEEGLRDPKNNPCWKGYKPVGTKKKGGRTVPNCVPKNEDIYTNDLLSRLESLVNEDNKECNHTPKGKSCPIHGLKECGTREGVVSEKAVSKAQQRFMGMVHAAQKGKKPASTKVAKVARGMDKKNARDFAATRHQGLPEKKPKK